MANKRKVEVGRSPTGRATHEPGLASRPGHPVGVPNAIQRVEEWYYDMRDWEMGFGPHPKHFALADLKIVLAAIPFTETGKLAVQRRAIGKSVS